VRGHRASWQVVRRFLVGSARLSAVVAAGGCARPDRAMPRDRPGGPVGEIWPEHSRPSRPGGRSSSATWRSASDADGCPQESFGGRGSTWSGTAGRWPPPDLSSALAPASSHPRPS